MNNAVPKVGVRNNTVPKVDVHNNTVPKVGVHNNNVPKVDVHNNTVPKVDVHDDTVTLEKLQFDEEPCSPGVSREGDLLSDPGSLNSLHQRNNIFSFQI